MTLGKARPVAVLVCLLLAGPVDSRARETTRTHGSRDAFTAEARPLVGVPSRLAALLLGGKDGGNLPVFVTASPLPGAGERASVPFAVEIDGGSLLAGAGEKPLRVQVIAYALDGQGRVKGHFSQFVRLDLQELGTRLEAGGVKFFGRFEIPPGTYSLRFLARVPTSERFALRTLRIAVPGRQTDLVAPPSLLFADPSDAWVRTGEADDSGAGKNETFAQFFASAERRFPAALPVLHAGHEAQVDILFYEQLLPSSRLAVWFLDSTGEWAKSAQLTVIDRGDYSPPGLQRIRARFRVPELGEGTYGVAIAWGAVRRPRVDAAQVAAYVLAEAPAERPAVWTDAVRGRRRTSSATSLEGMGARKKVRAIGAAYREALAMLADGFGEQATERLVQVETEAIGQIEEAPERALAMAELAIALALADQDAAALLPLVIFHMDLQARYSSERQRLLATHARRMAVTLAEEYAERVAGDDADRFVSQILALMGSDLLELQLWPLAGRLFAQALEYDPENSFALLSLALGFEKRSQYADAASYLRRLVRVDPKTAEGRIRLAINLERIGRQRQAERIFWRVIGENNPEWTLSIAYQELARLLVDGGRRAEAIELLEDGVARLPLHGRLRLQLANLLERDGQRRRAQEAVESYLSLSTFPGESARYLYNSRAQGDRAAIRQALEQDTTLGLAALVWALDQPALERGSRGAS